MDYNSGPYTVQFNVGVTNSSFNVMITDDNILENDETFNLNINTSSLPNAVTVGAPDQATVTIPANDGKYSILCKLIVSYYLMLLVINAVKLRHRH